MTHPHAKSALANAQPSASAASSSSAGASGMDVDASSNVANAGLPKDVIERMTAVSERFACAPVLNPLTLIFSVSQSLQRP